MPTSDDKRDSFISFNKADRPWATWIAWLLEEKGYSVFFQDWDFKGNFVLNGYVIFKSEMDKRVETRINDTAIEGGLAGNHGRQLELPLFCAPSG